jgi:hypothetical protein
MSYQEILTHGKFYYPAWMHYNRQVNVICDRCHTEQLNACIGYMRQDLCLICANEMTRSNGTYIGFPSRPAFPGYQPRPPVNPNDYFEDYK